MTGSLLAEELSCCDVMSCSIYGIHHSSYFFGPKIHYCTLLRLLSVQEGSEGCSEKSLKHKGRGIFRYSSVADPDPGSWIRGFFDPEVWDPGSNYYSWERRVKNTIQLTQIFSSASSKKLKIISILYKFMTGRQLIYLSLLLFCCCWFRDQNSGNLGWKKICFRGSG
jgi:hypothetical protein